MKKMYKMMWVAVVAMVSALGGCSDADEPEMGPCDRKRFACVNSSYKAGAGAACMSCCNENGALCSMDKSHGFYDCPDKE